MTAKMRIDLSQGVVEAEGSEAFVERIYNDFKEKILSGATTADSPRRRPPPVVVQPPADGNGAPPANKSRKKKVGTPQMVNDLNLSGVGGAPSLRDFYANYKSTTNFLRNVIFIYYLQNKLGLKAITVNHVFTCYRNIPGVKIPGNLIQSLYDTKARQGWVDTTSLEDLKLTVHGVNHLEHDMKKDAE